MPTYVYRCLGCGHITERKFRIGTAPPRTSCAVCKGDARRTITAPAVHIEHAE